VYFFKTRTQHHHGMVSPSVWVMEMGRYQLMLYRSALLSNEFLDLCHARNRIVALTIVYWAVLLDRNSRAWWLKGWLLRLVRACEELFESTPELNKWLDWPIEMSKHQPDRLATLSSTRASPMVLTPAAGTTPIVTPIVPPIMTPHSNLRGFTDTYQGPVQT
jgi:hypothetical protein